MQRPTIKRRKGFTYDMQELADALCFLLMDYPCGLLPFMHEHISLDFEGWCVDPSQAAEIAAIIDKHGGRAGVGLFFRAFARQYPKDAELLSIWSQKGRIQYSTIPAVAAACGYKDARAMYRRRDTLLRELAYRICRSGDMV